jgi:poly-beta-1,6-N-acetyl-D-glucosamine synthase
MPRKKPAVKLATKQKKTGVRKRAYCAYRPRVIALLPAHNEEDIIQDTIKSLINQTYPLDYILVIADNCTDNTLKVVRQCQKEYGASRLRYTKTVNNTHKKAGALNYGFKILRNKPELIFGMDADTILDRKIIAAGVKQFKCEPKTGGICSACRVLPLKKTATFWERLLWRLQNIEYGLSNAWRVEDYKSARVLSGAAVMFRTQALKDVNKHHRGKVWATDSLVEDYRLTLEMKEIGWNVKSSLEMIAWSDVPLQRAGHSGLFNQRLRWYSGTVDEIRHQKLKPHSRYEIFGLSMIFTNLFMRFLLYATYIAILVTGGLARFLSLFLLMILVASAIQFTRWRKYADQRDKWQAIMTLTLIATEIYAIFREITYVCSVWVSYRRFNRAW